MSADVLALGQRAEAMLETLATISADPNGLTRLYLSEEHRRAAQLVGAWMRAAGLQVRMDAAGTMHGLQPAGTAGPLAGMRLLVGSHIDTVVNAGKYDGNLGVVAGILAVEELGRRGVALPFALEVLAFGDEEGVRFPKTLLGSSVCFRRASRPDARPHRRRRGDDPRRARCLRRRSRGARGRGLPAGGDDRLSRTPHRAGPGTGAGRTGASAW